MKDYIKRTTIENKGAVSIVEATIVFPVTFFVLFFIMMLGNIYYQQAKIDGLVAKYAVIGAQRIVNPFQKELDEGKNIETNPKDVKTQPYRYIFDSMTDVQNDIRNELEDAIKKNGFLFLGELPDAKSITAKYDNNVLYGNFVVEASFNIPFPIKFIGSDEVMVYKGSSYSQVAINDVPEFIRNVDLAVDITEKTKLGETIKGLFDKVKEFIGKFNN